MGGVMFSNFFFFSFFLILTSHISLERSESQGYILGGRFVIEVILLQEDASETFNGLLV